MSEVSNYDDIIDSRDVDGRIEELQSMADVDDDGNVIDDGLDDSEREELRQLLALRAEGTDATSDWPYGATLIRDSHFRDYAMEYADDIGDVKPSNWPYTCIDWDQAARELQMDYTSVDYDGTTYWVR